MKIFSQKRGLKILFVGTEASPFVKVGGLASVMYSLPKALSNLGVDARVMIPRYLSINREYNLETIHEHLKVPTDNDTGESELICNIKKFTPKKSDDPVISYFLENQEFFEQRANVYGYADDAVRWVLLCRGALEFIKANENWRPDVIVASDWPTG